MELSLSEVKSRNAYTIVFTDCAHKLTKSKIDFLVEIIDLKYFSPLLIVILFQKLTYEICILKEINPDKPRNLAKTVTVG